MRLPCSFYWPDQLTSAEPFHEGLPHGVAKQFSANGRVIGTYTMVHGTGIDLWRGEREDGSIYLAEVLYLRDGRRQGFEWWINDDQKTVYEERHWDEGLLHGIWREWNEAGRLRKGFPKYHLKGEQVTKRVYLKACAHDSTLPAFRIQDNRPARAFPREIRRKLTPP